MSSISSSLQLKILSARSSLTPTCVCRISDTLEVRDTKAEHTSQSLWPDGAVLRAGKGSSWPCTGDPLLEERGLIQSFDSNGRYVPGAMMARARQIRMKERHAALIRRAVVWSCL